jgi:two-component system, response regulator
MLRLEINSALVVLFVSPATGGDNMDKVVLLVEDNPEDEELTMRAMSRHLPSAMVVNTYDGVEALEFLFGTGEQNGRSRSATPHLILLDLKLPRLSGLEVLRRIRKDDRSRALPVVMLTSSNQEQDILEAYCCGANGYVRKAVDYAEFCRDLGEVMSYWLDLNRLPGAWAD